jgi:tRNA (guanine10-N2)-dimethyltransferase
MHPKLARCLVNLSQVVRGDVLLDPFCGTGGILIEAGLCGIEFVGWDIDPEMVMGCRRNLSNYRLSGEIIVKDALSTPAFTADAIVTDPPYGRASYTTGEVEKLFNRFMENACHMLSDKGRVVLMSPSEIRLDTGDLQVFDTFDVHMHKSLTRRILVTGRQV